LDHSHRQGHRVVLDKSHFATQSKAVKPVKILARVGAVLSFAFFLIPGVGLLVGGAANRESLPLVLGFGSIGLAFFLGTILWVAGEMCSSKSENK
jgi:hypothetical protein